MNETTLAYAAEALRHYGLENVKLMQLGGISRTNFKAEIDDCAFVLHLYTAPLHRLTASCCAEIASELIWLDCLQQETSLVLPSPIANSKGDRVTKISMNDQTEMFCTLMSWVEGKVPPTVEAMNDEQLAQAGSLMAQLHHHSQQFKPPAGFTRLTYDKAYFEQRFGALHSVLSHSDLDKSDLRALKVSADQIIDRFAQLKGKPDRCGMIHGDFHSGNYIICSGEVRIIDFDRCGFGFYLFDLALALMELQEQQQQPFLQGYEAVKPLPHDYLDLKQIFLCLAYLDNLSILSTQPEELPFIVEELHFAALKAFRDAIERL